MVDLALRDDHDHLSVRCLLQVYGLPLERLRHLDESLLLRLLAAHLALLLLAGVALTHLWEKLLAVHLLLHLLLELLLVVLLQLLLDGGVDLLDADARVFLHEVLLLLLNDGGLLGSLVLDLLLLLETLPDLFIGPWLRLGRGLWVGLLRDDVLLRWLVLLDLCLLRLVLN